MKKFLPTALLLLAACGSGGSEADNAADTLQNAADQSTPAAAEVLENAADNIEAGDAVDTNAAVSDAVNAAANAQVREGH